MFIKIAPSAAVVCGALLLGGIVIGCESSNELGPSTPAEKTKVTSERLDRASKVMSKGEKLVADGQAERAKGMTMKDQGKTIDGEKYVSEGEAKIRQGQTMINEAQQYRSDALHHAQQQQNMSATQATYRQQGEEMRHDTNQEQQEQPAPSQP